MSVGALDVGRLHTGIDKPHNPSTEHEEIAELQLLDEILLHGTKSPSLQENIDEALGNDRPDVDQELACDSRMSQGNDAVIHADFPEQTRVLLAKRSATAFQVLDNAIELVPHHIAERERSPNECKDLVGCDRRHRSEPHDMLGERIHRLL